MIQGRPLTRDEARAQTRQEVLAAARQLFLRDGYEATTVARIAEAAGRTQGAIYSNFAGKEDLALAVIKSECRASFADLTRASDREASPEARLQIFISWWEQTLARTELIVFVAEYALARRRSETDPDPSTCALRVTHDYIASLIAIDSEATHPDLLHTATNAIVSTAVGAAIAHAGGMIESTESAQLIAATIRLWSA